MLIWWRNESQVYFCIRWFAKQDKGGDELELKILSEKKTYILPSAASNRLVSCLSQFFSPFFRLRTKKPRRTSPEPKVMLSCLTFQQLLLNFAAPPCFHATGAGGGWKKPFYTLMTFIFIFVIVQINNKRTFCPTSPCVALLLCAGRKPFMPLENRFSPS